MASSTFGQRSLDDVLRLYNSQSVPYISVEELKMRQIHETIVVLDTREWKEFEVSHIPDAHFVGYSTFSSEEITAVIHDRETPIVVYCSLGVRSEVIGEKLKKVGFTNVHNLYGGIFEWKNHEYVVLDQDGNATENVHIASNAWGKWLHKGIKVNN